MTEKGPKTAFTRCRHILKTMKNVTAAKSELAFTRCRNDLKTVGNLLVKSSLQDFDAKELYLNPKNRCLVPKAPEKALFSSFLSVFTMLFLKCADKSSVFKIYRFQNLPAKNVPFSCEQEAYPSNFSPFSKCAGIV